MTFLIPSAGVDAMQENWLGFRSSLLNSTKGVRQVNRLTAEPISSKSWCLRQRGLFFITRVPVIDRHGSLRRIDPPSRAMFAFDKMLELFSNHVH